MNTFQNLIDNGIEPHTAQDMLDGYSKRIGTMNGVYEITDITYNFTERGKDVTLKCSLCGREIHRMMISGRNKWSELIKSCPCQKAEKARIEREEFEKSEKIKKGKIQSDGVSMIGSFYGDYKIIGFDFLKDVPTFTLECTKCGDITTTHYQRVKNNAKTFRKCHKHGNPIKFDESYIGKKNNFLKVIGITRTDKKRKLFICECDCGNIKAIEPTQWEQGLVKSCGCFAESLKLEHTEELDRLRRIYNGMVQRCYNKNSDAYVNYGGRGITICPKWLNDREKFINWALSHGYENDLSIDRINVNGNYEPSNCRWATDEVQLENRRPKEQWRKPKRRKLKTCTIDGQTKPIREWYLIFNTSEPAIRYRMNKLGMTLEQALKTPKLTQGRPRKQ